MRCVCTCYAWAHVLYVRARVHAARARACILRACMLRACMLRACVRTCFTAKRCETRHGMGWDGGVAWLCRDVAWRGAMCMRRHAHSALILMRSRSHAHAHEHAHAHAHEHAHTHAVLMLCLLMLQPVLSSSVICSTIERCCWQGCRSGAAEYQTITSDNIGSNNTGIRLSGSMCMCLCMCMCYTAHAF